MNLSPFLLPPQKAMVAAKYREYFDKAAKERMQERKGNQPGARVENLPHLENAGTSRKLSVRCPPFHVKKLTIEITDAAHQYLLRIQLEKKLSNSDRTTIKDLAGDYISECLENRNKTKTPSK